VGDAHRLSVDLGHGDTEIITNLLGAERCESALGTKEVLPPQRCEESSCLWANLGSTSRIDA